MDDYFGFVYIWRDCKNNMFYIGSHVGKLDDGYVGSNTRLKRAYRKRPKDFIRRILYFCYEKSREKLLKKEAYWLSMIKVEELGKKYYNLKRVARGGNLLENYTKEQKENYSNKLKKSANTGKNHYRSRRVVCFNKVFETLNDAIEHIGFNPSKRLQSRRYQDFYYFDEGPLSEDEIYNNKLKKDLMEKNRKESVSRAMSEMPKSKRVEKAFKSAKTRAEKHPDIGKKISRSLKKNVGKRVSINGEIYKKGRIAAEKLKINYGTVKFRLKSPNFANWFYID